MKALAIIVALLLSDPPTPPPENFVNLAYYKGILTGTAPKYKAISGNLTGYDSEGRAWTGSYWMMSKGWTYFVGQRVTDSQVFFQRRLSGVGEWSGAEMYFLANGDLFNWTDIGSHGGGSPTTQTHLPDTALIGASGNLWTIPLSRSGGTLTTTWRLDPDINGRSKLILTNTFSGGDADYQEIDTFSLSSGVGIPYYFSGSIIKDGLTINLSGELKQN